MANCRKQSGHLFLHGCPRPKTIVELPPELWQEILSWLPVKQLMQFLAVSKLWRSVICDPAFARLHHRRSSYRGILISGNCVDGIMPTLSFFRLSLEDKLVSDRHSIFFSNTFDPSAPFFSFKDFFKESQEKPGRIQCTEQINGLVCLHHRNLSYLHNVATRESLRLPDPTGKCCATCSYHLGFHPVEKLYKLVKICQIHRNCEILTFGGGEGRGESQPPPTWRSIDSPPPRCDEKLWQSVCYDGVLYWNTVNSCSHIFAFDLSNERFFNFPKPYENSKLLRFGPGLSLYATEVKKGYLECKIITYHGNDDHGGEDLTLAEAAAAATSSKLKFQLNLNLPWEDETMDFSIIGVLPDGKVLMQEMMDLSSRQHYCQRCGFHVLDPSTMKMKRREIISSFFIVTEFTESKEGCTTYYEENIIPLSCLFPQ